MVHLKLQKAFFMYVSIENNNYYLDYTDLIILSKRLLTENEIVRKKWSSKFQYILVDEFQDLTDDEYRLIELLSSEYNRIFAVGDPDQSIYRFRGSNIDIFNNFYKNADERYDFVENYRSYQEIINLSYDLISSNEDRVSDVKLHCVKGSNKVPKIVHTADRYTEAIFVANKIIELMKKGIKRSECAILYRNNQCSLVFEEYFQQKKIPYKVYSNNEFFNCDEIKTAISYLKFIIYKDNVSFLNIYKKPLRYISNVMINRIKQLSSNNNVSYWEVIKDDYKNPIYKNCLTALVDFVKKIELINPNDNFEEWCLRVFNDSGFLKYVFSTGDEDKANHMKQLIDMMHSFELEEPSKNAGEEFLNYLALLSDGDIKEDEDKVQMMSIHCSKGMQYKYVFLVDFNEGYIPSSKVESKLDFAEERRIAYVAFTRAQEDFYILESNGEDNNGTISSFYNSFQKCNFKMIDYVSPESKDVRRLMTGSYIRNKFFGNGIILSINTLDKTCVVKFDDYYKEKTVDLSSVMLILNKKDLNFTIDPNIVEKIKQSKSIVYEIGDIVIHEKYGAGIITKLKDENNAFIQFRNFGSIFDLSSNYLIKRNDYIQFVEGKELN